MIDHPDPADRGELVGEIPSTAQKADGTDGEVERWQHFRNGNVLTAVALTNDVEVGWVELIGEHDELRIAMAVEGADQGQAVLRRDSADTVVVVEDSLPKTEAVRAFLEEGVADLTAFQAEGQAKGDAPYAPSSLEMLGYLFTGLLCLVSIVCPLYFLWIDLMAAFR
jgi:hypothetical protein